MIRTWKGPTPRAARPQLVGWWTCVRSSTAFRSCASMQRTHTTMHKEDEEVCCWPPKEWVKRYHARGGRVENPWWKLKRQLHGRRKAAKKFNEFVVTATVGLGLDQCPEQPSLFRRPGTTLIFELHQDDFGVGMASGTSGRAAQAEARRSTVSWVTVQLPQSDENEGDTIQIAPRETYIKKTSRTSWVSVTTSANQCQSPIVQTRQKRVKMSQGLVTRFDEPTTDAWASSDTSCATAQTLPLQSMRLARRLHLRRRRSPAAATIGQISFGYSEAWHHDSEEQ